MRREHRPDPPLRHALQVKTREEPFSDLKRALRGSLTELTTPFSNEDICEKAFVNLVDWQIEQGSQGLNVGGVTGEGSTLTLQEFDRLLQIAVGTAAGSIPVIAATGTNRTRETILLTQAAETAGAAAALIVAPYYNKPSQLGIYRHYFEIARSVGLPLIIENNPSQMGVDILAETLAKLAEIPNIVAIEDARGDPAHLASAPLSVAPNLVRLSGDDTTCVLSRMAGRQGSVSVVANVAPDLWAEMQKSCSAGDWSRATAIQMQLSRLLRARRLETNPGPIKYALSFVRPWFSPEVRLPLTPVSWETGDAIVAALTDLELVD